MPCGMIVIWIRSSVESAVTCHLGFLSLTAKIRKTSSADLDPKIVADLIGVEGSRLRLPEAFRTPPGAASSAPPGFSPGRTAFLLERRFEKKLALGGPRCFQRSLLAKACCEMSRRDGAIVAWHEVPGTAPPPKSAVL